jgi:hypothetical protein
MHIQDSISRCESVFDYRPTLSDNTSLFGDPIEVGDDLFILDNNIDLTAVPLKFIDDDLQKIRVARNQPLGINSEFIRRYRCRGKAVQQGIKAGIFRP